MDARINMYINKLEKIIGSFSKSSFEELLYEYDYSLTDNGVTEAHLQLLLYIISHEKCHDFEDIDSFFIDVIIYDLSGRPISLIKDCFLKFLTPSTNLKLVFIAYELCWMFIDKDELFSIFEKFKIKTNNASDFYHSYSTKLAKYFAAE